MLDEAVVVLNNEGRRSGYRVNAYVDHLASLGVPRAEAKEIASAVPAALRASRGGAPVVSTNELRRLAHDVASVGAGRLAMAHYFGKAAEESSRAEARPRRVGEVARCPLELHMEPLHRMATVVRRVNPSLADTLTGITFIVRSVCENVLGDSMERLAGVLRNAGLTEPVVHKIGDRLLAGPVGLNLETIAARTLKAYGQATDLGYIRKEDPARSFLCSLMVDFDHALSGGKEPVARNARYWSPDSPGDVPFRFRPPQDPTTPIDDSGRGREYRKEASIEFPSVAGWEGDVPFSVYAVRTVHASDDIEGPVLTYRGDEVEKGVQKDNQITGPVSVRTGVSGGGVVEPYRPDIEHINVVPFWLEVPEGVRVASFRLSLTEKNRTPLIDWVLDRLHDAQDDIDEAIEDLGRKAGEAVAGYLNTIPGLQPLAPTAENLAEEAVEGLVGKLRDIIMDAIGHTYLPSWYVVHATLRVPPAAPLSVFTVQNSKARRIRLHQVERQRRGDTWVSDVHLYYPDPGFSYHARRMVGHSQVSSTASVRDSAPPVTRNPSYGPTRDLWQKVSDLNEPVVWADSEAREGFRVLVPFNDDDGDGSYVAALRADVVTLPQEDHGV